MRVYEVGKESNTVNCQGLEMVIECDLTVPPLTIGKVDYYFNRFDNFMQRHADCKHTPPDYYYGVLIDKTEEIDEDDLKELIGNKELPIYNRTNGTKKPDPTQSYGHKYCTKFTNLRPELTSAGQIWLDKTLKNLQKFMEMGVVKQKYISEYNKNFNIKNGLKSEDGVIDKNRTTEFYTNIELENDKFRSFAFATHPDAYDPNVMQGLPAQDLFKILCTPEWKEWLHTDTWEQAWIMACEIVPHEVKTWEITKATWEQLKKDYPEMTKAVTDQFDSLEEKLEKIKKYWDKFMF